MAIGRLSLWFGLLYVVGGIWSYALYLRDKEAAGRDSWRTPEKRLHYHDLAFGIIGGLIGQHIFRHKTSKPGFGVRTSIIVAVHVMVLGLVLAGVFRPGEIVTDLMDAIGL